MTIAEPGMFVVWAVLTAFAAVGLGALVTVFIYERVTHKFELLEEAQDELADLRPRYNDAMAQLSQMRERIHTLEHELSLYTDPDPDDEEGYEEEAEWPDLNGLGQYYRSGHKIHILGCVHLGRANNATHLWSQDAAEVRQLADEYHLTPCKTCQPWSTDGDDTADESGAATARDEEHPVGWVPAPPGPSTTS